MKKVGYSLKKSGGFRCGWALLAALALLAVLALAACSSSSSTPAAPADVPITPSPTPGAGTSGDPYPGETDPAAINDDNAQHLLMSLFELSPIVTNVSHMLMPDSAAEAKTVEAGIEMGDESGQVEVSDVSFDDATAVFEATATFTDFQAAVDEPVFVSGSLEVRAGYRTSGAGDWLVSTFNDLVAQDSSGTPSFTLNGEVLTATVAGGFVVTMNVDVEDNNSGKVYRLEGAEATVVDNATAGTSTITVAEGSKYYDYDAGYIYLSTPQPLVISWALDHPIGGQIKAEEEGGGYVLLTATDDTATPPYHFTVIGYGVTGFTDIHEGSW
ncbi:hypothetical protein ACHHRT_08935 [Desulfurivibrio sp. D14AmB]|uniref:hypothetical protein n=1 Tax=Desulfurivibrio sp. D14AmB TaxID=3374370 RepID=UPI00376EBFD2